MGFFIVCPTKFRLGVHLLLPLLLEDGASTADNVLPLRRVHRTLHTTRFTAAFPHGFDLTANAMRDRMRAPSTENDSDF